MNFSCKHLSFLLLEQDEWKQKEMAYRMLKNSPRKDEAEYVFLELQQDLTKFEEQKQYHMLLHWNSYTTLL